MIKRAIHIALVFALITVFKQSAAQVNIPVLSWQTHFSYNNVNAVTQGDNKVFASADHGIFFLDLDDNSVNLINKNNGLSDVDVASIQYDSSLETLIIGYKDGGIDFWQDGSVTTLTTVEDATVVGSKAFRNIQSFKGDIYFVGDLGIVIYNPQEEQITRSFLNLGEDGSPLSINELLFYNDSIYAATDDGLLSAPNNSTINLQDFNSWNRSLTGLKFETIQEYNGLLVAGSSNDLFFREANTWQYQNTLASPINDLILFQNSLFILCENDFYTLDEQLNLELARGLPANNRSLLFNNSIWLATQTLGITNVTLSNDVLRNYIPNGPRFDHVISLQSAASGLQLIHKSGFSTFSLGSRRWIQPSINRSVSDLRDGLFDFSFENGTVNPVFADFNLGLVDSTGAIVQNDISSQTVFQPVNNSFNLTAVAQEGADIWLTSTQDPPLYKWTPSTDVWTSFALLPQANSSTDLFLAKNGDKWITIEEAEGGGIVVFNETTGRERYLNINGGQGGLPGRKVNDLVYDLDEFLWIASNSGIAFYPNPDNVLNGQSLTANVPIFENRLLLRNQHITTIAVDPANRKWFGSLNNGLWLFSEAGDELIYHFTAENSPLPSNQIIDLSINPSSGELFIATNKGMISFRGDATEGLPTHSNVKIYPNPIVPNFQGNVVMEGLVNNANVKITDVSGKLVREIRANGSTGIWNLRDLNNTRVSTGVYLIFSSNSDGSETFVGKIVVI